MLAQRVSYVDRRKHELYKMKSVTCTVGKSDMQIHPITTGGGKEKQEKSTKFRPHFET